MNVKTLSVFISIYMAFAILGGLTDGQLIRGYGQGSGAGDCDEHTGDAKTICQTQQLRLEGESDTSIIGKVGRWFTTGFEMLKGWANMLALNFSFFSGDFAFVGWIVRMIIAVPIIAMLVIQRFGGG